MSRIFTFICVMSVLCYSISQAQPTTQANGIVISPVSGSTTSLRFDWAIGNGTNRLVIIKTLASTYSPTNLATSPTANTAFPANGAGADLDATSEIAACVFNSTGTTVTVTALTAGTVYVVQVYEYTGSGASTQYLYSTNSTNPLVFQTFTSAGTNSWSAPTGVNGAYVQAWGGGGGGGNSNSATASGGGGGGGGGYSAGSVTVTAGNSYNVFVGAGGRGALGSSTTSGNTGRATYFGADSTNALIRAYGGVVGGNASTGGAGGATTNALGTTKYAGGAGGGSSTSGGGAGGSSAGTGTGGTTGAGAATNGNITAVTTAPTGGGNGGYGNSGSATNSANGEVGHVPGGGGGGSDDVATKTGGNGADGMVIITYEVPTAYIVTKTPTSPTNQTSVTFTVNFSEGMSNISSDGSDFTVTGTASTGWTLGAGSVTNITSTSCDVTVTGLSSSANGTVTLGFAGGQDLASSTTGNLFTGKITSNQSFTIDTTAPTVSTVSSAKTDGSYNAGVVINITVQFSEVVNVTGTPQLKLETGTVDEVVNYTSGTGTNTLTFAYTIQAGDTSPDLDYFDNASLTLNGGTIKDAAGNDGTLTLAAPGAANSLGANKNLVIDTTAPTVSNVSSTSADATYILTQTVDVTVQFSENVTVAGGTPQITLETGTVDRVVNYSSGSGTNTLTFTYTVQSGDTNGDLDYVGTSSLALNGATIKDAAGNNATLTLATPGAAGSLGANKAIVVDGVQPTVTNVTSTKTDGTYTVGASIDITVQFSAVVNVTGTPQLKLETGTVDENVNYVSGSGTNTLTFTYVVQSGDASADLDLQSTGALTLNGGTINSASGNPAILTVPIGSGTTGALAKNKALVIDTSNPGVTGVSSTTADGSYKATQVIHVTVTFNQTVLVTGTPQLKLETGTVDEVVNYTSGSGSATLVFDYTVQAGDTSPDLDYFDNASLTLNGGTIKNVATNNAVLTLPNPGAANSLGANKNIIIDTTSPTVSTISSSTANGSYNATQVINITVQFSEVVNVTGTPQLKLETGTTDEVVNYSSGTGTNTLTFAYTVQAGDTSPDLDYFDNASLTLNGGTINDAAGNAATLTLAAPGAANSLGANKNIIIDTTAPTVSSVSSSTTDGTYIIGQVINVTVTFTENVTVTGTPQITLETGTVDETVNYSSGSTTNTLTFAYTVQAGDASADLDYISTSALALNGGTIKDAAGNNATLTLATPGAANSLGANKAIVVDGGQETVTNVSSSTANGSYKAGQVVAVTVQFSGTVTVTGTPQITLETGGTDEVVNYTSGSGTNTLTFNYTVQAGDVSADLDLQSAAALALNGGTIKGSNTNNAALTVPVGSGTPGALANNKNIIIDTQAPTVSNVTSALGNGSYKAGQVINITVQFSEVVNVTGTPQLKLETGTTDEVVNYTSGTGTNTLTFAYTVQSGDTSPDLDYFSNAALTLNGGTISDAATNNATLTLANPGAAGSLGANKAFIIDTTAPTVSLASSDANGYVRDANTVTITATFVDTNGLSGTPTISISCPSTSVTNAAMSGGPLVWTYAWDVPSTSANDGTATISVSATDPAGNSNAAATGTTSQIIDNTPPTMLGSAYIFYDETCSDGTLSCGGSFAKRENVVFEVSEALATNTTGTAFTNGGSVTFSTPNPGTTGVRVWDSNDDTAIGSAKFYTSLTMPKSGNSFPSLGGPGAIQIISNADNSKWTGTSQASYLTGGNLFDLAGNEFSLSATTVTAGSSTPPVLSPDVMTLYLRSFSPEKIIFTLDQDLQNADPSTLNGFSLSSCGGCYTVTYSGKGTTNTVTILANGNNRFDLSTMVSYSSGTGNVVGQNGVPMNSFASHVVVQETDAPVITNVSIPAVAMKVGDVITATITTNDDDGDIPTLTSGTIDGFTLNPLSFNYVDGTTKTATFQITNVSNGSANVASGSSIPVANLVLTDSNTPTPNVSATYSTPIAQSGDPIDAQQPTITNIAFSQPIIYEGQLVQTVTVTYSETMSNSVSLTPTITMSAGTTWVQANSGGTNGWSSGTTYVATMTHSAGTFDSFTGVTATVNTTAQDAAGNSTLSSVNSSAFGHTFTLDNTKPTATVTATSTATPNSTINLNNLALTVKVTFSEVMNTGVAPTIGGLTNFTAGAGVWSGGNTIYTIVYTHDATIEGPVSRTVTVNSGKDANGNVQTALASSTVILVDTQKPTVTSINNSNNIASGQYTNSSTLVYTVVFSEAVTLSTSDFTPFKISTDAGSPVLGSVTGASTLDNITWTITVTGVQGDAHFRLDVGGATGIKDLNGNSLTTAHNGDQPYIDDMTAPFVQSMVVDNSILTGLSNSPTLNVITPTSGGSFDYIVTFSEPVTGLDVVTFASSNSGPKDFGGAIFPSSTSGFSPYVLSMGYSLLLNNNNTPNTAVQANVGTPTGTSAPVSGAYQVWKVNGTYFNGTGTLKLTFDPASNRLAKGAISTSIASLQVNGSSGSNFLTSVSPGDQLYAPAGQFLGIVGSVSSDNLLTLNTFPPVTLSNVTYSTNPNRSYTTKIKDLAGNTITPLTFDGGNGATYTFSFPEPTNAVSTFAASGLPQPSSVTVQWTNPAAGSQSATHYLVMAKPSSGGGPYPSPTDGTYIQNGPYTSGGGAAASNSVAAYIVQNVPRTTAPGSTQTATFSSLLSGTNYDFRIYPYSMSPLDSAVNGTVTIDFNSTAKDLLAQPTAIATSTKVARTSGTALPISSLANSQVTASTALQFSITDDGLSPNADNSPTKFSQLVISQGAQGVNGVTDWTTIGLHAELSDGVNTPLTATASSNTITFSGIASSSSGNMGYIGENQTKTYTLKVWVNNSGLTDDKVLDFVVNSSSFTYDDVSSNQKSSQVSSSSSNSADSGLDYIQVLATRLNFTTQPFKYAGTNEQIDVTTGSNTGVVTAQDVNGNTDLDFTYNGTVSAGNYKASVTANANPSVTGTFTAGILDLTGMKYTSYGLGTLTVSAYEPVNGQTIYSTSGGSTACNRVDVIDVTASNNTAGVTNAPNLKGGTINTIFGVDVYPNYYVSLTKSPTPDLANEPSLTKLIFSFTNSSPTKPSGLVPYATSSYTSFTKTGFTVYEGATNVVTGYGATVTAGQSDPTNYPNDWDLVIVTFPTPRPLYSGTKTYYLSATVSPTAISANPSMQPQLVDAGYNDPSISITYGSAKASVHGYTYNFATTQPPTLKGDQCVPFVGQLNVNPDITDIALKFSVKVLSFDGKAQLYDRATGLKVADLTASNGVYNHTTLASSTADSISFHIPAGTTLVYDHVYYVTVPKGSYDPTNDTGTGISDDQVNLFGGITSNAVMYFKIIGSKAPNMVKTDPSSYTVSGSEIVFNASFDQAGTAYYLVLDPSLYTPASGTITTSTTTVTGVGTLFNTEVTVGANLYTATGNLIGTVASIGSNTSLTLTANSLAAVSGGGYSASPLLTSANIKGATVTGMISSGSTSIDQLASTYTYFIAKPTSGSFNPLKPYDIYICAENDATKPAYLQLSAPYVPSGSTFIAGAGGSGAHTLTLNNVTNAGIPIYQICPFTYSLLTQPMIINETVANKWGVGSQDFNILLPSGFEFDLTALPTVNLVGSDFGVQSGTPGNPSYVNSTILKISFTNSGTSNLDQIIITGLRVKPNTSAAAGSILRFGGTGITDIADLTTLAKISAVVVTSPAFTNTYDNYNSANFAHGTGINLSGVATSIPDNFLDRTQTVATNTVTLLPTLTATNDFYASTFSGSGVTDDILSLSAVSKNAAFTITMSHNDPNGCPLTQGEQYTVYDHTNILPKLTNPNAINADTNPLTKLSNLDKIGLVNDKYILPTDVGTTVTASPIKPVADFNYNEIAGYRMDSLILRIPQEASKYTVLTNGTTTGQIIYGLSWQSQLDKILAIKSPVVVTPYTYLNYTWDYAHVLNAVSESSNAVNKDPYSYFIDSATYHDSYRTGNQYYYHGGSLGFVDFIGRFQNTADLTLYQPLVQRVELFVPPIPIIQVNSNSSVIPGATSATDVYVFCEYGNDILFSGYPVVIAGQAKGVFTLYDDADVTNTPLTGAGFVDNANGTATLSPKNSTVTGLRNSYKKIRVEYTYQDNNSPVSGTGKFYIQIAPNPVAVFTETSIVKGVKSPNAYVASALCQGNQIDFDASLSKINGVAADTTKAGGNKLVWDFGDATITSSLPRPSHTYALSSTYPVTLTLTSQYGCPSTPTASTTPGPTQQSVKVGEIPKLGFVVSKNCVSDSIVFDGSSSKMPSGVSSNSIISSYSWNYNFKSGKYNANNLPNPISNTDTIGVRRAAKYSKPGYYDIQLTVTSSIGCADTIHKPIGVLDFVAPFSEYFDNGTSTWQTVDLHQNPTTGFFNPVFGSRGNVSWGLAQTSGRKSNTKYNSATGNLLWSTSATKIPTGPTTIGRGTYYGKENSALITPCLNLDTTVVPRPMISYSSFVDVAIGDGVVLQQSTDDKNILDPSKTWTNVGNIGDGLDWFTSNGLPSNPGNDINGSNAAGYGWSGHGNLDGTDTTFHKWIHPKHALDFVSGTKPVVLRFALASAQTDTYNHDGVGIDSVFFGSRTRTILFENFTTTNGAGVAVDTALFNEANYINTFVQNNINNTQLVNINYHVGFVGQDPFNLDNPADQNARALYYGVNKVPYAFLDGVHYKYTATTPPPVVPDVDRFRDWGQSEYDLQTLVLANADFSATSVIPKSDGSVDITVSFLPLLQNIPIGVNGASVQVAILEKVASKPAYGTVSTSETSFHYVFKQFLPSAAGRTFTTPITYNNQVTLPTLTYKPSKLHSNTLTVVVFLQDVASKTVYQAYLKDDIVVSGVVTAIEPTADNIHVYPNPADQEMTIELPSATKETMTIRMANQLGQFTEMGSMSEGEQRKTFSTGGLSDGVYILQLGSNNNAVRTKVIVLHR